MTEQEARVKFRQIVLAVEYCHKKGIVHRDLKVSVDQVHASLSMLAFTCCTQMYFSIIHTQLQ